MMNTIIRRAIMMAAAAEVVAEAPAPAEIHPNNQKVLDRIGNHLDRGRRIQTKI